MGSLAVYIVDFFLQFTWYHYSPAIVSAIILVVVVYVDVVWAKRPIIIQVPAEPVSKPRPVCVVCQAEDPEWALRSCGHLVYCTHCLDIANSLRCPICRVPSRTFLRIYM
jgi:hypothetical protein